MNKLRATLLVTFLLFSHSSFARSFGAKGQVELNPYGGYAWPDTYGFIEPKNAFLGGLGVGYWFTNSVSAEISAHRIFSEDVTGLIDIPMDALRLNGVWNLFPKSWVRPFLTAGIGLECFDFAPTGVDNALGYNAGGGLRMFFNEFFGIRLEGRYILTNADFIPGAGYEHNIETQAGLFFLFGKNKIKPQPVITPAPTPETAKDSDVDGVSDEKDQCAGTEKGIKVNEAGCEVDSDSDGILDSKDKCNNTPNDTKVDETGCPEIVKKTRGVLKGVNFVFGKAELTENSKKTLNEVAEAMKSITDGKVEVQGHTDNIGTDEANLKISVARAQCVVDYLVSQGVDTARLAWRGYGPSKPIAGNETSAGRAQNRRVELKWLD